MAYTHLQYSRILIHIQAHSHSLSNCIKQNKFLLLHLVSTPTPCPTPLHSLLKPFTHLSGLALVIILASSMIDDHQDMDL